MRTRPRCSPRIFSWRTLASQVSGRVSCGHSIANQSLTRNDAPSLSLQATQSSSPSSSSATSASTTCGPLPSLTSSMSFLSDLCMQHPRRAPPPLSSLLDPPLPRDVPPLASPLLRQPPPRRVRRPSLHASPLLDRLPRHARDGPLCCARVRRLFCAVDARCPLGGGHGPRARNRGPQDVSYGGQEA